MICKVNEDLTERLVQHDDCDHYGARKQFYLHLTEQLQNWGHRNKLPVPWAALPTHRRLQNHAWQQFWWASHSSHVSPSQGLWQRNSYWALVWQKQTGAIIPPDRLQQHSKCEQLAYPKTLQQQKTRRYLHQTIAQKFLEHPSGEPQQHHTSFLIQRQQQHNPQQI